MRSTLYRNGVIHSPSDPFAEAVLVTGGHIAWIGSEDTVHTVLDGADEVVDLDGALVTPAFVDAHVHVLETAFALEGLDLSPAAGVRSLRQALDAVADAARRVRAQGGAVLLGHGWDETTWPEGRPPTRTELDSAADGMPAYLSRTDVHSAVVTSALADAAGCVGVRGWTEEGLVTLEAHHHARAAASRVGPAERDRRYRTALAAAARSGIAAVHEHSTTSTDTREGLAALLAMTQEATSGLPLVVGYRAELCETADDARALREQVAGLTGIGGDLTVDGSLGSRTAALRSPYADLDGGAGVPGGTGSAGGAGALLLSAEQITNHVTAVTRAGAQAAFHVIGDRAMDELLLGMRSATDVEGVAVRTAGHRVEHAEMVDARALGELVLLGLTVSAQPRFDALWGGPGGMYARRLGEIRAAAMNPFADLAGAGVPLAFGSDSPVTPFDPWGAVRAAVEHHEPSQRISARAAFRAHTRGGWRAARLVHTGAGEIRLGSPAHLAIWRTEALAVQAPDGRTAAWSTDRRAGTPLLPELGPDVPAPVCLRTLRDGVVLHDQLG